MSRFRIIPVFILTRDRRSGFALKSFLEEQSRFPYPVVAEVYLNPREMIPHLSLYDTNFIVVDFNQEFIGQVQDMLDMPVNLAYEHEIILRSPAEHYLKEVHQIGEKKYPVIQDGHDFRSVAAMIREMLRLEKKEHSYKHANYLLAGMLMMIAIITAIIIL